MTTLTGNFVQIGPDGRRIGGKLTLAKPGRLRFDYDQPSPLEIVADGTSVAVKDRKLGTQDLYFISQTPLKFLLREKIDLARDLTVTDVGERSGRRADLAGGPLDARRHLEDPAVLRRRGEDPEPVADHRPAGLPDHGAALEPAEGPHRRGQACSSSITGAAEDKAAERQIRAQ